MPNMPKDSPPEFLPLLHNPLPPTTTPPTPSTTSSSEVTKFSSQASTWFTETPNSRNPLLEMNPSRLTFILSHLPNPPPPPGTLTSGTASFKVHNSSKPLSENPKPLKWLEVGPGGGILISSLLRLGLPPSSITACEPSPELCALIKSRNRDLSDVRNGFVEDVVCDLEVYDVVTLLEVIEHVDAGDRRGMIEKVCG
eukprot:CAMPEP_0118646454 /NCGR_PEP_ID=MMETSP0785-20121206/8065_1 /TAXON_ID=91992 /ORGANISM="Bolidomonas pacifica, Strain CCMP 1866" /LENGTH=196 /DNA_ID=CAMNT_0006538449 /DNA_START=1314 /DNA_END=1902 /DNA_ORIENTATION=+